MDSDDSSEGSGSCPGRGAWTSFILGCLSGESQERLASHLELCPDCPALLDELEGIRDEVVLGLHRPPSPDPYRGEPEFSLFLGRLSDLATLPHRLLGARSSPSASPRRLGRFEIRERLGQGGFGQVYRAHDPVLRREVAVKIPWGHGLTDGTARERLLREGWAASRLKHPNILRVFEAGEADGSLYIASEYCAGPTLAQWADRRSEPVPFRLAAELIATLAEAVHHAHERGICHRDLKPSNVLLDPCDDAAPRDRSALGHTPKLADFGLAKILVERSSRDQTLSTRDGAILGTPDYMAPEQASGDSRSADATTDVYALGAILYRLLTGRPPFKGEIPVETLRLVIQADPLPPGRLRPGLPRDLEVICLKCLAKPRRRRYASAALLAEDLRLFLDGRPILARPAGATERAWRWARRRPALATTLLSAALAIVAVAIVLLEANRRLSGALNRAESSERAMGVRVYAADIQQAWLAWKMGNLDQFRESLEHSRPGADSSPADDHRGFEWYFLRGISEAPRRERIVRAHAGTVTGVRYAPDGRTLATCGLDGLVKLWDPAGGRELATLRGHQGDVNGIAYSPDGATLVSAGDDRTVRLWDVATRRERLVIADHPERVFSLAFSHDGRILACGGRKTEVFLWDPRDGESIGRLHVDQVRGLAFRPGARSLFTFHENSRSFAWDTDLGPAPDGSLWRSRGIAHGHDGEITGIGFDPSGRVLATASFDQTTLLRDADDGRHLARLRGHHDSVRALAFTPDGLHLATGSRDAHIRIWDVTGNPVNRLHGHDGEVSSLEFSPDGRVLASGGADGTLRLWDWRDETDFRRKNLVRLDRFPGSRVVALAPDGDALITSRGDGPFRILELPALRPRELPLAGTGGAGLQRLVFSADGRTMAATSGDGCVRLWSVPGFALLGDRRIFPSRSVGLAFSPDGRTLASSNDTTMSLWRWGAGDDPTVFPGHSFLTVMAYSADGRIIATGDHKGAVEFLDPDTLRPLRRLRGHAQHINGLAFSPDGRLLATAGEDLMIRLWQISTGRELRTLRGHVEHVTSVAFSRDGRTLISGDAGGTVRFWQVTSGQELFGVDHVHSGPVVRVDLSRDGRRLLTSADNGRNVGEAFLWDASADSSLPPSPSIQPTRPR